MIKLANPTGHVVYVSLGAIAEIVADGRATRIRLVNGAAYLVSEGVEAVAVGVRDARQFYQGNLAAQFSLTLVA